MVSRVLLFIVAVLFFTGAPAFTAAQPRTENDRSIPQGSREAEELIERSEYLLAVERLNGIIDSASPGANLSTPLFLLTEANAAVDRNYPALDAARRFLLLYPGDPRAGEVRYRRGITAYREEKREEAKESFAHIVRGKDDREAEAYYWLARLMADADSLEAAEELADRSLQESTHEFTDDALYLSAWIKEGRGDYRQAADLYRRVVDEFPESELQVDAQLRLGVNQARNGYHESALTLFSSLTPRSDRQREELLFYTAESNAALGRHERAIDVYNEFLRSFPASGHARAARYGLGWSQLQARQYSPALTTFRTLTDGNDSLAAAALYQIGAIHTVRGDTASALNALHELVYRLPYESFSDNAYYQLGRIHYRRENYDSARHYLQIAARQFPESDVRVEAFYLLGESYAALQQYDNAHYSFSRTHKVGGESDSPPVRRALYREGVMLYYVGRFNSAVDRLRRYVAENPAGDEIDEATFWLAEALYQDGVYDEAERFYETVVERYPNSRYREQAMYGVPWSQFQQKKFTEAVAAFDRFIKAYPDSDDAIDATIRMADAYRFLRQYDKAIATYESVGGRGGSGARAEEARIRLAEAFIEMKETEKAVAVYRDLVRLYPKSSRLDAYAYSIGTTYFNGGEDSLAVVELERFVNDYPESEYQANALFLLGDAWYNLGNSETALDYYQAVLDRHANSPIIPEAMAGLRFALESMGRGPEAIERIEKFERDNPDRLPADSLALTKGKILFDNAEYTRAEEILRKMIADYPESGLVPDAWYLIGKGREYGGDFEGALATYQQIVRNYPTTDAALEGLIDMASLRLFNEDFAGAGRDFRLFIERFDESGRINEARYGAGQSSIALGDTAEGAVQFRTVIDAAAADGEGTNDVFVDLSRIALAEIFREEGKADSALDLLSAVTSSRLDATAAEALLLSGRIRLQINDLSMALAELRRLTTEFTDFPEYAEPGLLELGMVYEVLTNTAEAIATYQQLADTTMDEELKLEAENRITRLKKKPR